MIIEKHRVRLNKPVPIWGELARRITYDGYLYNNYYIPKQYEEVLMNKKIKNLEKFFGECNFSKIYYPLEQSYLIKQGLKDAKKVAFFGLSESAIKSLVNTNNVIIVTHPLENLKGFKFHNIWSDPIVETYASQLCYEDSNLSKQYDLEGCYVVVNNDISRYGWILGQVTDFDKVFIYNERTSRFV